MDGTLPGATQPSEMSERRHTTNDRHWMLFTQGIALMAERVFVAAALPINSHMMIRLSIYI